jgi:hypothetical protein
MKILAHIPALVSEPAATPWAEAGRVAAEDPAMCSVVQSPSSSASAADPAAPIARPANSSPERRQRRRRPSPRFPFGSVAALAAIAALAWSLASWNDGRRAEHSRLERLARMQSFSTPAPTVSR